MGFKTSALLTAASVLLASAPAFATTFTFDGSNLSGGVAGKVESITTSFNDNNNKFSWSSTYQKSGSGISPDGLWLVANDGPNPKGQGELAIYYLDGIDKKVSIFEYSGANNANSFKDPGNFLGSTTLEVIESGNEKTFAFNFDMDDFDLSGISDKAAWKGSAFDKKVGLWVHGVSGLKTKYDTNGLLTKFGYAKQSAYDVSNKHATAVPEPASAAALGLFAVAGAFVKRSKQSA